MDTKGAMQMIREMAKAQEQGEQRDALLLAWRALGLKDSIEMQKGKSQDEKNDGTWISAEDAQPEVNKYVLVATKSKNGARNVDKGYWTGERWAHRGTAQVTHWVEIPEVPEDV